MDGELHRKWLSWAESNHLGSESQRLAAAQAAMEAASRGATSEEAARAARGAAAAITTTSPGDRSNQSQSGVANQPVLSPGGVTWEIAMAHAGKLLAELPMDPKAMGKAMQVVNRPEFVAARVSMAQAWIAFARELTMRGRVIR